MTKETTEIHPHVAPLEGDWTARQEEVNALMFHAVGLEGLKILSHNADIRKAVRTYLDTKNAKVAALQEQIQTIENKFKADLKDYLAPLVSAKEPDTTLGGGGSIIGQVQLSPGRDFTV